MPDKRYTKVEEEVLQILDRLESEKPAPSRPNLRLVETGRARKRPARRRSFKPSFGLSRLVSSKPWIWIAASIGLAFLAIVARDTSQNLAFALALASIIAFFAPIFLNRRPSGPGSYGGDVKLWRGRDISLNLPSGPSPAERAGRWLQDRRRRGPRL